jgi:hypothetical protein
MYFACLAASVLYPAMTMSPHWFLSTASLLFVRVDTIISPGVSAPELMKELTSMLPILP